MERISSGHPELDELLSGGLPADAINFVIGAPGTGKTILAEQYVFHNATADRPALYYSTLSEPYEKLLRYGQRLSFFDVGAVGTRVFYLPLAPDVRDGGLASVVARIAQDVRTYRPSIIAIDSFRALAAVTDETSFRMFLADLADLLSAYPVSVFWIGEYTSADIATAPEFAVADTVLAMSREDVGLRETRYLQVLKLRGSTFLSGKHVCRISQDGIHVFPRLADPGDPSEYAVLQERTSSGIAALDALLYDGFRTGSSTLVAGPGGAGKTLLGLHFIMAGARMGEPGVFATLQENPSQLEGIASGFGWSLREQDVALFYASTVDLYVDEWMHVLHRRMAETGARRVVLDSLGDVERITPDPTRFRELVYSFIQRCARSGVSALMTLEVAELFGVTRVTEEGFSHLADNVVLLQYVREGFTLKRALTVIKSRGSPHDPRIHNFDITPDGIKLVDTGSGGGLPTLEQPHTS